MNNQVEVMARRGETPSYIAIDQFEFFRGQDICDFEPKEAIPDPNTTPAPNPSQAMDCGFQSGPCKYNWDDELYNSSINDCCDAGVYTTVNWKLWDGNNFLVE